jgi:ABC-2 type transport system permease protein
MKVGFERLGIDYAQWKVLTRTALKLDFRGAPSLRAEGGRVRGAGAVALQILIYTLMGLVITVLVAPIRDPYLAGTLLVAYAMFMIAVAALLDHNATIVSADDYAILGFRPISSRTFFAGRLTNMLVYTTAMTTLFGYLPILFFFVHWGARIGLAGLAAVYMGSGATALAMVAVYAGLMRSLGPQRLKQVLSYVQLATSTVVYGGYFLLSSVFTTSMRSGLTLHRGTWLFACPAAWFASYMEIVAGTASARELGLAGLSLVAVILLTISLLGRLSIDYSERLGAMMTETRDKRLARRSPARRWLFGRGESRAVAILVWSQFRNDTKFQMAVLAILPLTILYMIMGIRQAGPTGTGGVEGMGRQMPLVTVAMLLFPTMLEASLVRSDAYRASWIFFASPSDRARLLRSAKNILLVTFLVPYMLLTSLALMWFYHRVQPVLLHVLFIGLLSHLLLQIATLIEPELPFSKPVDKGRSSSRIFALTILTGAVATGLALAGPFLYQRPPVTLLLCGGVVALSLAVDRWMRLRVERKAADLEFVG